MSSSVDTQAWAAAMPGDCCGLELKTLIHRPNTLIMQRLILLLQDRATFTRKNELIFAAAKIVFEKTDKMPLAWLRPAKAGKNYRCEQ